MSIMSKNIKVISPLFFGLAFLAIIGILTIIIMVHPICKSYANPHIAYQSHLKSVTIYHSKMNNNIDLDNLLKRLKEKFLYQYNDSIASLMGRDSTEHPEIRLFIQFKPDQETATFFFDYFFLCKECPYFELWRANMIVDSLSGEPILATIIHRRISPDEYLTYKSMKGGDEN